MSGQLTGRTKQIEQLTTALALHRPGPVMVTGAPGTGRSSLLGLVRDLADPLRDEVIELDPACGPEEATALTAHLRGGTRDSSEHRRPVLVLDDVHLADHAVVRMVRDAHRRLGAVVVVSRPDGAAEGVLDCLRYEPGARFIALPPLTAGQVGILLGRLVGEPPHGATAVAVHAATGGSPALLADLVTSGMVQCAVEQDGVWRLGTAPRLRSSLTEDGVTTLSTALERAWQALDLDQVEELSTLALSVAPTEQAAAVRAFLLLLRGRAAEGLELLGGPAESAAYAGGMPGEQALCPAGAVLIRAMLLALGLGRFPAAEELLRQRAAVDPRSRARLRAYRAWLLTLTGRPGEAADALEGFTADGDLEAALFARAAVAGVALGANRPAQAVAHLRRALIDAQRLHDRLPWLPAWLTAYLIDASLLAGRITEATTLAADFHAAAHGSGWDVAVALSALTTAPTLVSGPSGSPTRVLGATAQL